MQKENILSFYQTLPQVAEVAVHLLQEQLQLAPRHVEFLPGVVALLCAVFRLELRPQSLKGRLMSLPVLQLLLQSLQTTTNKNSNYF